MILAVFSIFFGFITKDIFIGLGSGFFSDNALFIHPSHEIMLDTEFGVPTLFKLLPLFFTISLSVISIVFSEYLPLILIYFKLSRVGYNLFSFFNQRFLIELFYNRFITGLVLKLGGQTTKVLDKGSIEYLGPYGLEKFFLNISGNIAKLNTGMVTSYALYILVGLIFYILSYSYFDNNIIILVLVISLSLVLKGNYTHPYITLESSIGGFFTAFFKAVYKKILSFFTAFFKAVYKKFFSFTRKDLLSIGIIICVMIMIRWPLSDILRGILPLYLAVPLSFLCGCVITRIIQYLKNIVPLYNSPVLGEYIYKDIYNLIDYYFYKHLIFIPLIETFVSVKVVKVDDHLFLNIISISTAELILYHKIYSRPVSYDIYRQFMLEKSVLEFKQKTILAGKLENIAGSIPCSNPTALEQVFAEHKLEQKRVLHRLYKELCTSARVFDVNRRANDKL